MFSYIYCTSSVTHHHPFFWGDFSKALIGDSTFASCSATNTDPNKVMEWHGIPGNFVKQQNCNAHTINCKSTIYFSHINCTVTQGSWLSFEVIHMASLESIGFNFIFYI